MDAQQLRRELQEGASADLQRRRGIISFSLLGMASMAAVTLLQTGIVSHLPDPPLPGFNSDQVNSSETAYKLGVPDGTLSLASLALNIPLAAFGGEHRATEMPWVSLCAAAKAGVEAAVAGWFFTKEKTWCAYCLTGIASTAGVFLLTLPEALKALRSIRSGDRQGTDYTHQNY